MPRKKHLQMGGLSPVGINGPGTPVPVIANPEEEEKPALWKEMLFRSLAGLGNPFGGGIASAVGQTMMDRYKKKRPATASPGVPGIAPIMGGQAYGQGGVMKSRGLGKATRGNSYKHC